MYIARLLRKKGLRIGHERMLGDGSVGWFWAASRKWGGYGQRGHRDDWPDKTILHQVRHPLKVIASTTRMKRRQYGFIDSEVGLLPREPLLPCAASFWLRWNLLAESVAEWTYRIEDIYEGSPVYAEFCRRLQIPERPFPQLSRTTNTRKHDDVTWDDLKDYPWLVDAIKRNARRWGYDV